MKKEKKRKTSKLKIVIILVVVAAAVAGGIAIASQVLAARSELARKQSIETIVLEKGDITRTVSVSGVVESARITNIYTTQSFPVKEILVKVGDSVKAGDVLAELDMSRLDNDIAQTEINLRSAIASANEELRGNDNSIVNAQTSLEASRISLSRQQLYVANAENDLKEAEERMTEDFDSYTFDNMIDDTRLSLERRTSDLEDAQKDLNDALFNFDDYSFQNAINEARINVNRRKADFAEAERAYDNDMGNLSTTLYAQQTAVNIAEAERNGMRDAHTAAEKAYNDARAYYQSIESDDSISQEDKEAALAAVTNAKNAMDAARKELSDAEAALSRARTTLQIARDTMLGPSERAMNTASDLYSDAQRAYTRAVSDLDRAKTNAVELAADKLTLARNAHSDAQRLYEKALEDKRRAIDSNADSNETRLDSAQRAFDDSRRQLESSENSVKSAENSLSQARSRPASQGANVEIQEINLDKLHTQLAEGKITATADGVVTEVNAKVGAIPNGIIFVIEDTSDLYVSARVREHSIATVLLGQDAVITTDATGDVEYDGSVSYISPRAVSAAGSTSVEFEVRAEMLKPDPTVKIGMNAFLNIIIERKHGVYAVPNSVIVTNERGSFVYTIVNDERLEIEVSPGIRTMANTEVSGNGLYDGMELLIDPEGLLTSPDEIGFPEMWRR